VGPPLETTGEKSPRLNLLHVKSDTGYKLTRVRGRSALNAELSWKRRALVTDHSRHKVTIPLCVTPMLLCDCFARSRIRALLPVPKDQIQMLAWLSLVLSLKKQ
jgi:hypothetical protein